MRWGSLGRVRAEDNTDSGSWLSARRQLDSGAVCLNTLPLRSTKVVVRSNFAEDDAHGVRVAILNPAIPSHKGCPRDQTSFGY